jgi:hypothetical protein
MAVNFIVAGVKALHLIWIKPAHAMAQQQTFGVKVMNLLIPQ